MTTPDIPTKSFIALLEDQFIHNPDSVAIIHNDDTLTYRQLHEKAMNVAATVQDKGLKVGDRVILYMPDKLDFLIIHLGIILSGGVSLPLNFSFTKEEMLYFINDSEAEYVFASGKQAILVEDISGDCPSLKEIINPAETVLKDNSKHYKKVHIVLDDNCFILYSSGTTGTPKGVVHTHRNLAGSLLALQKCWRFTSEDVLLNALPLFHIHGLSFATHLSLITGSSMILEDKIHPIKTMNKIADATVFMAVPTIYYAFLRRPEFKEKAKDWKRTRLFTCGSAPIRPEVLPELETILGSPLINRYGMTESHVITSLPLDGPYPQGSVGLPLDGIELKLVTEGGKCIFSNSLAKEDYGTVGEVKIRSDNLFDHYWKNPEASAREFDKDGFFSTGDLGRLDELGFLTLAGRIKDLIIVGGYNVYPPVVERVINGFPQVKESAVIGIDDQKKGEQVVAVVVADGVLDINKLKQYCQDNLVNYQTPTRFVILDALPRNTMGKILKRVIKADLVD